MKINVTKNEFERMTNTILNLTEGLEVSKEEKDKMIHSFLNLKNFESKNLNVKIEDDSIKIELSEDLTSDLSLTASNVMLKLYKLTKIITKKFKGEDYTILEFFNDSIELELSTLTNKYPEIKIESEKE